MAREVSEIVAQVTIASRCELVLRLVLVLQRLRVSIHDRQGESTSLRQSKEVRVREVACKLGCVEDADEPHGRVETSTVDASWSRF
jgi:hypothetical protein